MIHQYKYSSLPSVFNKLFTKLDTIHLYHTRQKHKEYIVPRKRVGTGQKSLAYIRVKIWESFDPNLKG